MMLDSRHVEACSKEISRWARAIRTVYELNDHLPTAVYTLPDPDEIEPGRKPYDLTLKWFSRCAKSLSASLKLRMTLDNVFDYNGDWHDIDGWAEARIHMKTTGKRTIALRLLVWRGDTNYYTSVGNN